MSTSPGLHTARSPFASAAPLAHRPLSAIAATLAGGVPQHRIQRLLAELLPVLEDLHREHRICGDISVHSVGLDELGHGHLIALDTPSANDSGRLTLTAGYAAYELLTESPNWPRGPWTDVYGLSAVVYSLVTGQCPPPAEQRVVQDDYQPLTTMALDRYSEDFLHAIDVGMSLRPEHRPQNLQAYAALLMLPISEPPPHAAATSRETPVKAPSAQLSGRAAPRNARRVIVLLGLLLLSAVAVAAYWWGRLGAGSPSIITHSQRVDPAGLPAVAPAGVVAARPDPGNGEPPTENKGANAAGPLSEFPAMPGDSDTTLLTPMAAAAGAAAADSPPSLVKGERKTPASVKVSINVRPWGEILINGVSRGVTPPLKTVTLRPGTHAVTIRNDAQPPFHTTLVVKPGTPAVITHTFR